MEETVLWKRVPCCLLWVMFMSVCRSCDLTMVSLKTQQCKVVVAAFCR